MSTKQLSDRELLDQISDKLTDLLQHNTDIGPLLREAMVMRGLQLRARYRPPKYPNGSSYSTIHDPFPTRKARVAVKGVKKM